MTIASPRCLASKGLRSIALFLRYKGIVLRTYPAGTSYKKGHEGWIHTCIQQRQKLGVAECKAALLASPLQTRLMLESNGHTEKVSLLFFPTIIYKLSRSAKKQTVYGCYSSDEQLSDHALAGLRVCGLAVKCLPCTEGGLDWNTNDHVSPCLGWFGCDRPGINLGRGYLINRGDSSCLDVAYLPTVLSNRTAGAVNHLAAVVRSGGAYRYHSQTAPKTVRSRASALPFNRPYLVRYGFRAVCLSRIYRSSVVSLINFLFLDVSFLIPQTMTAPHPQRTPQNYLDQIDPAILESFNAQQLAATYSMLDAAIGKPSPKLIDLRLTIDLVFSRFYLVLFIGKDRRQAARSHHTTAFTRIANQVAVILLLLGLNLAISAFILLTAYLIKSALGINLFPSTLQEIVFGNK